ncbi:protein of unknown function [Pararobbsia alpina]
MAEALWFLRFGRVEVMSLCVIVDSVY